MALDYTTYVSQLSNLMVVQSTNAEFQTFLPGCIDYAEQRMYRELDLLFTRAASSAGSLTFTPYSHDLVISSSFIVVEQVEVFSPAGAPASSGVRNPLTRTSLETINAIYNTNNSSAVSGLPLFYAMFNNTVIVVGPPPDGAYTVVVSGTTRPTPLSTSNSSTFLTQFLPDAFMAASMVFASGYQRDFGGQSDNPAQSASWEAEYQKLIASAGVEEFRKKHQSQGWTSQQPNQIATPPRV